MSLILSLGFIMPWSFSINASELRWQDRCVYQWSKFLWFSYFNTLLRKMLPNMCNIFLETIGSLFLFPRSDVSEGRRLSYDPNEHIYRMRRLILREFNMEHLIRIFQKNNLRMEYIFESDHAASGSTHNFQRISKYVI